MVAMSVAAGDVDLDPNLEEGRLRGEEVDRLGDGVLDQYAKGAAGDQGAKGLTRPLLSNSMDLSWSSSRPRRSGLPVRRVLGMRRDGGPQPGDSDRRAAERLGLNSAPFRGNSLPQVQDPQAAAPRRAVLRPERAAGTPEAELPWQAPFRTGWRLAGTEVENAVATLQDMAATLPAADRFARDF